MSTLKMHTPDLTKANIDRVAALFPNCITETKGDEGNIKRAIDFDQLRQQLSEQVVDGSRERYHLDWPGKREALIAANAPIAKTIRPCREESVDFDATRNLFIEGDNLDALKLLQETYLNGIKMVYIDPPYNTGNDLIYDDDFAESAEDYFARSTQHGVDGTRLVANTSANGRFHSDWLSMMYPRLKLAHQMLRDDGILFISIGDDELHNLKSICDEVFGQGNFILTFSRMMKSGGAKGRFYTPAIDYILAYAKNISQAQPFRVQLTREQIARFYINRAESGPRAGELYGEDRLYKASLEPRPNQRYYIKCPDDTYVIPPGKNFPDRIEPGSKTAPTEEDGVWKWTYERYKAELAKDNIVFKQTSTTALVTPDGKQSNWNIYNKLWLRDQQEKGAVPSNFIGRFENRQSSAELKQLDIPFTYAKPTSLIKYLMELVHLRHDDIVLDYFAGSGSTAHAVMAFNAAQAGMSRYIMVQMPELCEENSIASRKGFATISEIAMERIRRAGRRIREEAGLNGNKLDIGFRVLKVDTSNMKDVYYQPDALNQSTLAGLVDNVKEDRKDEDLLFQVLLDWGVDLTLPIKSEKISGKTVYFVDTNALVACFEAGITEAFIKELSKRKPLRAVFRDTGYGSDATKINVEQIFKLLSPATEVKSI